MLPKSDKEIKYDECPWYNCILYVFNTYSCDEVVVLFTTRQLS